MATFDCPNAGPISYKERPQSPRYGYRPGVPTAQRILDVPYEQHYTFLQGWMGFPEVMVAANETELTVSRVAPQRFPYPDTSIARGVERPNNLVATGFSVEGVGVRHGPISYPQVTTVKDFRDVFFHDIARLTIDYEATGYRVLTDDEMVAADATFTYGGFVWPDESSLIRYVSRHVQPHVEYLRLPFGTFYYSDDEPAVNGLGRLVASQEITYTWHQVPLIPPHIYKGMGRVNKTAFADYAPSGPPAAGQAIRAFKTFPVHTLLCMAIEVKTYPWVTGQRLHDIVYKMKYFEPVQDDGTPYSPAAGHNHILRYKDVGAGVRKYLYEKIFTHTGSAGNNLFQEYEFQYLFRMTEIGSV